MHANFLVVGRNFLKGKENNGTPFSYNVFKIIASTPTKLAKTIVFRKKRAGFILSLFIDVSLC